MPISLGLMAALTGGSLLGGLISSQRKFSDYGAINNAMERIGSNQNLDYFQRIARSAGPSRQDLLSMAAATGGSQAAAMMQSEQAYQNAGTQALNQFAQYRQGADQTLARLALGKTQMKQDDFNARREGMTSFFNNLGTMGAGYIGNQVGFNQMQTLLPGLNANGGGFQSNFQLNMPALPSMTPAFGSNGMPSTINSNLGSGLMKGMNFSQGVFGNNSNISYSGFGLGMNRLGGY